MNAESLAFRTAKKHVDSYSEESANLMAAHDEAMDCRDCEAFLQMGIDAFDWLMRADRAYHMAMYRSEIDHDPKLEDALARLCEGWLVPCEFAERWIERQLTNGYQIDNLEGFRRCVTEMSAIVEVNREDGDQKLPEQIAELRDTAIQENRNGETAEFVLGPAIELP